MRLTRLIFSIFLLLSLSITSLASTKVKAPKTKQKKLSCEQIFLSKDGLTEHKNTSFLYGSTFYIMFNKINGFNTSNDAIEPQIMINIYDSKNNFVFGTKKETIDIGEQPAESELIYSYISIATPINSNETYRAKIKLTDKKGTGYIKHEFSFRVQKDKQIEHEKAGISYKEAYIFSLEKNVLMEDHKATFNETVYFNIEGLKGLTEKNNLVNIGMDLKLNDEEGNLILEQQDLIPTPASSQAVAIGIAGNFTITESKAKEINTRCTILLYDKYDKSKYLILTTTVLFSEPED